MFIEIQNKQFLVKRLTCACGPQIDKSTGKQTEIKQKRTPHIFFLSVVSVILQSITQNSSRQPIYLEKLRINILQESLFYYLQIPEVFLTQWNEEELLLCEMNNRWHIEWMATKWQHFNMSNCTHMAILW